MNPLAIKHREAFAAYVKESAVGPFEHLLPRLYQDWEIYNEKFFEGKLVVPYILITETAQKKHLGDCCSTTCFGGLLQIRLRPDIIKGTHRCFKGGSGDPEGLYLFASDVLLHEMIHQYQYEILDDSEQKYKGHGPLFCTMCNKIGSILDFEDVRTSKRSGPDKDKKSCAYWPDNVRKDAETYYKGVIPITRTDKPRVKKELQIIEAEEIEQATTQDENVATEDQTSNEAQTAEVKEEINNLWSIVLKERHKLSLDAQSALEVLEQQYQE